MMVAQTADFPEGEVTSLRKARVESGAVPLEPSSSPVQIHCDALKSRDVARPSLGLNKVILDGEASKLSDNTNGEGR